MSAETQPNNRPAARSQRQPTLDEHLRAWGLRHAPFAATAAPADKSMELHTTPAHRQIRYLLDTTAALRGVMTLTGSPGTGKSTLIKSWIAGLEPKRFLPLLITQSSLSATGVLETLLSKLGEPPGFKRSTNLLRLEKHLADLDPITLVLVLDDSQNYPAAALEEIRLLLGWGGRARSAFALILLGDEYLLGSLRLSVQRALFSRISASATLHALSPETIPAYLAWHVSRAGLEADVFAPAAIDLLAQASEGNPRTLGLLAQAAWLAAAIENQFTIQPAHVHTALRQVPSAKAKSPKLDPCKEGPVQRPSGPCAGPVLAPPILRSECANPRSDCEKSPRSSTVYLATFPRVFRDEEQKCSLEAGGASVESVDFAKICDLSVKRRLGDSVTR